MTPTLYHYVHCPFCIRVRMAFGYLKLPYHSKVLAYEDEPTPVSLTGVKVLPALTIDGKAMNESLDIIALVDTSNALQTKDLDLAKLEGVLKDIGETVHTLAMPYWIWTPEFTPAARAYFKTKKEKKRGPFRDLVKNQAAHMDAVSAKLALIENDLRPFYDSEVFGLKDILLAAHVWGLYVVPEFQFTPKLHSYLQQVKALTNFNYHEDFWRDDEAKLRD